ncbi:MAG TPA: hypothetical protein VF011_06995 [Terriglobales bacterium]
MNTFCQANGQATVHAGDLVCLVPNLGFPPAKNGPDPIAGLTAAIASQANLVPLASPASGIIYNTDPSLQILVPSGTESFGPVLSERGETLRRHKAFVAFSYQRFGFNSIDRVSLKAIPAVFLASVQGQPRATAFEETSTRVDLTVNQFALYATYGLTDRIDVSVAVPILNVRIGANSNCNAAIIFNGTGTPRCNFQLSNGTLTNYVQNFRQATGLGDVVFRIKGALFEGEHLRLAAGLDVRVPSGNELNFLGTGAAGLRPFLVGSLRGRVSPHVGLAYQWNGHSDIASIQGPGVSAKLPDNFSYAIGMDARVVKRLTLSGDILGEVLRDALREAVETQPVTGFTGVATGVGSYNTNYASIGGKLNPAGNLLVTLNVLLKLDHYGLRNKPAPLIGLSYTF